MSLKVLPAHVRLHLYLFWTGMAVAGLGVIGFFLSFWQVGSASQASIDVHTDIPVIAYISIAAWVGGLLLMWYSRRTLDAAVARKLEESAPAASEDGAPASDGAESASAPASGAVDE